MHTTTTTTTTTTRVYIVLLAITTTRGICIRHTGVLQFMSNHASKPRFQD